MFTRSVLRRFAQQSRHATPSIASRPVKRIHHPSTQKLFTPISRCQFSTASIMRLDQRLVDQKMEEITELYGTARDEFEIAAEETEKMTVYAADDRAAAREELTKLQDAFKALVEGPDQELGDEIKRRVGPRIRELDNAVTAMEEMAHSQD